MIERKKDVEKLRQTERESERKGAVLVSDKQKGEESDELIEETETEKKLREEDWAKPIEQ